MKNLFTFYTLLLLGFFLNAQNLIEDDFSPIDDMRASKNYRNEIHRIIEIIY